MTVAGLLPRVASGALLVASGYVLRWLHERYQQTRRGRIVEALGGKAPGPRRLPLGWLEWVDIAVFLILCGILLDAGIRHLAADHEATMAKQEREAKAIRRHLDWLRNLPEAAKRQWPVTSYCRLAAAPYGRCACHQQGAEMMWPERLEGGDVACHTQW